MAIDYRQIDNTWTLFMDRDGVIVEEEKGSYITDPSQVKLYENAGEVIAEMNKLFYKVIEVTNQRCIGRGIISKHEFHDIQDRIEADLEKGGGHIDKYYYAPGVDNSDPLRKPNTGMAMMAQEDFPAIDFSKSLMIGNNMSDMEFGKKLNMQTVFLATTEPLYSDLSELPIDEQYRDLEHWYESTKYRFGHFKSPQT